MPASGTCMLVCCLNFHSPFDQDVSLAECDGSCGWEEEEEEEEEGGPCCKPQDQIHQQVLKNEKKKKKEISSTPLQRGAVAVMMLTQV